MNAVELTCELVRIDTINPRSPERPAAELCARLLEKAGWQVRLHEFAPGRASVVARHRRKPAIYVILAVDADGQKLPSKPLAGKLDAVQQRSMPRVGRGVDHCDTG